MNRIYRYIINLFKKKRNVESISDPEPESQTKFETEPELEAKSDPSLREQKKEILIADNCSICCELLESDLVCILSCGHYYHNTSIQLWFEIINTSPECREIINTDL